VAVWTMRLADAPISTWIGNWLIKKFPDQQLTWPTALLAFPL